MAEIQLFSSIADRFPSRKEAWRVFLVCLFPIHFWITIIFLYNFPGLILKANLWQILGVLGYSLVFAFIESLLLFGFLVLLATLLPSNILKERFISMGTILALVIPGLALLVKMPFIQENTWAWLPVVGVTGIGLWATVRRSVRNANRSTLAERFALFAWLYIFLDLLALLYLVVITIVS